MENKILDEKHKQTFDERLIEIVRGKKNNPYEYLREYSDIYNMEETICVQYNPKQRPVTSFGVAIYNIYQKKWMVVEPKFTIEFITLLRGAYTTHYLPFLLDQLFDTELEMILKDPEPTSTKSIPAERIYQKIHDTVFCSNSIHILYKSLWMDNYNLIKSISEKIVHRRRTGEERCMQFVFPKGRSNNNESWAEAAVRELMEETGIKIMFDNPTQMYHRLNSKYSTDTETNIWEPCRLNLMDKIIDGYISKLHVTHTHSTIGGKLYRTVVWICVISMTEEETNEYKIKENSETRLGTWLGEPDMKTNFRVQELYAKCEMMLNKYYPYLSF